MTALNMPRSVQINGTRTSMRLERDFWDALKEIAEREESTQTALLTKMVKRMPNCANKSAGFGSASSNIIETSSDRTG